MPDPTPAIDLDADDAYDVARLAKLTQQMADLKETAEEIKARLRERLPLGHRFRWQGVEVLSLGKIGSTFDPALAATYVPDALYDQICTPRPDASKAKRILPPELYAKCCTLRQAAVKTS